MYSLIEKVIDLPYLSCIYLIFYFLGNSNENSRNPSKQLLPWSWSIAFFLACFGVVSCTFLVWYMFCSSIPRHENTSLESSFDSQLDPLNSTHRNLRRSSADGHSRPGGHRNSGNNDIYRSRSHGESGGLRGSIDPPPSLHQLPSYKLADYNQPPPSYDEAVRETLLEAVVLPSQVVNYISDQGTNSIRPQQDLSPSRPSTDTTG